MDKHIFSERMKALSMGGENRTAHARIEDDFPSIQIAIIKKVNRKAIWEAWNQLQPDELKVPQKTFESAVYRILNKRTGQFQNTLNASRVAEQISVSMKGENLDPVINNEAVRLKSGELINNNVYSKEEMIRMANIAGLSDRRYKPQKSKGDSK